MVFPPEWLAPAEFPSLTEGEVHVWGAALDEAGEWCESLLNPMEIERASRFRFSRDRRRFAAGRAVLRVLLSRYLSAEPLGIPIACASAGKPFVDDPSCDVRFNLSHSGGLALYAFARGPEVGVDIEAIRADVDIAGIASRFFTPVEAARIAAEPEAGRIGMFYAVWVRKEAYAKATGEGIAAALAAEEGVWHFTELDVAPGIAAAIATRAEARIRCYRVPQGNEDGYVMIAMNGPDHHLR